MVIFSDTEGWLGLILKGTAEGNHTGKDHMHTADYGGSKNLT